MKILNSLVLSMAFGLNSFAAQSLSSTQNMLSKKSAFEILKTNGFKWKMTTSLNLDAEAKTKEAQSEFNPRFQLGFRQYAARINPIQFGGANPTTIDTVGFGTSAFEMSWTMLDPAAKAKLLTAEANEKISAAQTKHYQNELTALMLIQYLNVQKLRQQIELMDANLEKSQLILKLATTRKNVGAGIPLDVARAKNLVQLDQLKKMAMATKYSKAKHELLISLGQYELSQELPPLVATLYSAEEPSLFSKRSTATRNDLKVAQLGLEASNLAKDETGRTFFPKLAFLGEVGTTQPTMLGFPAKNLNGFVGLSLSIPLDSGGLITAKRQEAAVLQMKADLQLKQTQAEIDSQSKEAVEQLLAAQEAVKASADYVKTAAEESQYAEKRYNSGASNILELTNAHTSLASARDTEVENVYNYEAAKVSYFRTLGDFTDYFLSEKGD